MSSDASQVELAHRLNGALRTISISHKTLATHALQRSGLHPGQESVLEALAQQSPQSNAEIAAWIGCEPPTVTSTVSKLESAGLVSRRRSEADARVIHVEITEAGRQTLAGIEDDWVRLARDVVDGELDEQAVAPLLETLEALAARLRARRDERNQG